MELDLLFDPDSFFADRAEDPGLLGPALLVLVAGIVGALSGIVMMRRLTGELDSSFGQMFAIVGLSSVIGAFVGVLVVWVLYAGVFHGLSAFFDGEGSFKTTFALAGWGFLPSIVSGLVTMAVTWVALGNVPPPETVQEFATFQQRLESQQVFVIGSVIGIGLQVWQWFIWTFAVRHARSIDLRSAAIVVGVPVGLSILWSLYALL